MQTDRPERVSGWFKGRVPFHLALPDYPVGPGEQKFYELEGGRLVSYRDDYAASSPTVWTTSPSPSS